MEGNIRSLVMKAWQNRWSAAKFSVQCRKLLDVPSSSYLAELLLNEALVGTAANDLLFSYLQQLLTSQSIPLDRVLMAATQFDDLQKPQILLDLIRFIKGNSRLFFLDIPTQHIVQHCDLIASHMIWLFIVMYKVMLKLSESEKADPSGLLSSILVVSCDILETVTLSKSRLMVIRLAKLVTHSDCYQTLQHNAAQLTPLLPYLSDRRPDIVQRMTSCIAACERLECTEGHNSSQASSKLFLLTSPVSTVASLVTIEALGYPTRNNSQMIRYLRLYKDIQRLEGHAVVVEIVRSCISGLLDSEDIDRIYWLSFTYIKLPLLLAQLVSATQRVLTIEDLMSGLQMIFTHTSLLNKAEYTLKEPKMMDFLVQELTKNGTISTAQEAQLIEILSTQRVPGLAEGGPDSPIPHLFNCQDFIDSVLSDLIQVHTGPDIIPCGTKVVQSLSQLIASEELLNKVLISAACAGKLSKLANNLLRLNELSIQSSQNEMAVLICDLTLLILTQAVLLFSKEVISAMVSESHSSSVFMSRYISPLTHCIPSHPNIGSNDCLDELLGRIVSKQKVIGIARFSDMILCLPLAFVELAKARQLSAIDESTIVDVITEVSQTSHTLLLYSLASLVNQARLSPPDLRQKQLHIINSISQVSTADPARDSMMRSIITRLLESTGLCRSNPSPSADTQNLTVNPSDEPMMVTLAKSIESILETGYISTKPYRSLVINLKFTEPKWLVQKMLGLMFKCTYIEEIGKALALLHMICHLALPSLVPTFINEAIPDLLHKTVKPTYLAEPRSQSACQLIVWSLVSLSQQDGDEHSEMIRELLGKIFKLMDGVYQTAGTNQAIYIMELLIQNMIHLGLPYSKSLLDNMPIRLLIKLLSTDSKVFTLLCGRQNLTVDDVNLISSTLLYRQSRSAVLMETES